VQVLSEFLNVCRVKLGMDIPTRHKLAAEPGRTFDDRLTVFNPFGAA
jgi:hypothetical protein